MDMVKYHFAGSYRTITGIARLTGVSEHTIRGRLKRGLSINDAVYPGHLQQRPKPEPDPIRSVKGKRFYTFEGKTQSLRKWAKQLGIKEATLRDRIHLGGWSVERAFTTPPMPNFKHRRLRKRNAEIIRRMLDGFTNTGGYSQTFPKHTGTGVGRHALHLQSEKELSP